jgi:hypothetical protein
MMGNWEEHISALATPEILKWAARQEEMPDLITGGAMALAAMFCGDRFGAAAINLCTIEMAYYLGYQKAKSEAELEALWGKGEADG